MLRLESLEDRVALSLGSILGTVFNDVDRDGLADPGEAAVGGWTVFLDLDQDGWRGGGEPTQATAPDGSYVFSDLAPGQYVVAVELPSGARQTSPSVSSTPLYSLVNPSRSSRDDFGVALASESGRLAVGAEWDDTVGPNAGRAYLFDGADGTLQQAIPNPFPQGNDCFGAALAIAGNSLFVGAFCDDHFGADAGAVFQFDASTGARDRTFPAPTELSLAPGDCFGQSLALHGDTLAVSAPQYGTGIGGYVGVFDLTGGGVRTILNPTGTPGDNFGYSLAWVGDQLAVSAPRADGGVGKVYLFDPATGAALATFSNPLPDVGDAFGSELAAAGNALVVTASDDDDDGIDNGILYVFNVSTGDHRVVHNSTGHGEYRYFGTSLATHGNEILAGSLDDVAANGSGAAFRYDATTGDLLHTYVNPYPAEDDEFGCALALVGNRVAVGARFGDNRAGGVYVFAGPGPGVGPGMHTVTLGPGQTLADLDFGLVPPVQVESVVFDAGQAGTGDDAQRSTITRIQIYFAGQIAAIHPGAFTLARTGSGAGPVNLLPASIVTIAGRTVATLRFDNTAARTYRRATDYALADGNYRITVDGARLDGQGGTAVASRTDSFFRYFGDADGDRDVDGLDLTGFRRAISGDIRYAALRAAFDFDGDRTPDAYDYRQFRARCGRRLSI